MEEIPKKIKDCVAAKFQPRNCDMFEGDFRITDETTFIRYIIDNVKKFYLIKINDEQINYV